VPARQVTQVTNPGNTWRRCPARIFAPLVTLLPCYLRNKPFEHEGDTQTQYVTTIIVVALREAVTR
jgi:hypothetical protein